MFLLCYWFSCYGLVCVLLVLLVVDLLYCIVFLLELVAALGVCMCYCCLVVCHCFLFCLRI